MIYQVALITIALTLASLANAFKLNVDGGSLGGNGGDVIVCPAGGPRPEIQLLDLYELEFFEGEKTTMGDPTAPALGKVDAVLSWLSEYSPRRAQVDRTEASTFFARTSFVDHDLIDIPDSQHLVLPVNCEIRQLAIQERQGDQIHYTIDQRLWNRLDTANQAALILHEMIYTEALASGQKNSINTRAFLRQWLRRKDAESDRRQFFDASDRLGFKTDLVYGNFSMGQYALLRPEQAWSYLLPERNGDWRADVWACGYRLAGAPEVDHCDQPRASYSVQFDRDGRIVAVRENGRLLFHLSGAELGLPFDVSQIDKGRFVPLVDVHFSDVFVDVHCAANKTVFFDQLDDAPNGFVDLEHDRVNGCETVPEGEAGSVLIWDRRFHLANKFQFWLGRDRKTRRISKGEVKFKNIEEFQVLGQKVSVNLIRLKDEVTSTRQMILNLIEPTTLQIGGSACMIAAGQNISWELASGKTPEVFTFNLDYYSGPQSHTCRLRFGPKTLLLSSYEVNATTKAVTIGRLAEKTRLRMVAQTWSPVTFEERTLEAGTWIKLYNEEAYDYAR